jgi:DNA-binding transcriptional LysR family regulator
MDRLAAMDAFVRVVDAGSFSGAAKQLRIGQPAVSKAIVQLEERLSVSGTFGPSSRRVDSPIYFTD